MYSPAFCKKLGEYMKNQQKSKLYSTVTIYFFRYRFLGFSFNARIAPNRENCKLLLKRLRIEDYALGKSKVCNRSTF